MPSKRPATMSASLDLIGEHASIVELRRLVLRVARSKANTVLIYGETGTGKGLVARMLHQHSERHGAEFIDINCAAIPGNLLESELFGYERGAFTGAAAKKQGLIEAANGGTVFLDEIRELDPVMQAKILTVLDARRFRRLGSVEPISVDVRFIAATNRILLTEVREGKFRDDLYYRLQVIAINIPPLRERGDDIFLLTERFLAKYNAQYGSDVRQLEAEVERIFRAYAWPGNVRELENLLERICILADHDRIEVAQLPQRIVREARAAPATQAGGANSNATTLGYLEATAHYQRDLITQALAQAEGHLGAAAARLSLTRHALRHQMHRLGIQAPRKDA